MAFKYGIWEKEKKKKTKTFNSVTFFRNTPLKFQITWKLAICGSMLGLPRLCIKTCKVKCFLHTLRQAVRNISPLGQYSLMQPCYADVFLCSFLLSSSHVTFYGKNYSICSSCLKCPIQSIQNKFQANHTSQASAFRQILLLFYKWENWGNSFFFFFLRGEMLQVCRHQTSSMIV